MKIEHVGTYQTRCGEWVRVVCTDAPGGMPVIVLHEDGPYAYTAEGKFHDSELESQYDLMGAIA